MDTYIRGVLTSCSGVFVGGEFQVWDRVAKSSATAGDDGGRCWVCYVENVERAGPIQLKESLVLRNNGAGAFPGALANGGTGVAVHRPPPNRRW